MKFYLKTILLLLICFQISAQKNSTKEIDIDYENSPLYFVVNSKRGLILREKPNQNSKKLAILPDAEIGFVIGQTKFKEKIDGIEAHWYEIQFKANQGWIFSGFTETDLDYIAKISHPENRFFLIQKKPIYLENPSGKKIKDITEYPNSGEFLEVDKQKNINGKLFLHFNMGNLKGWISEEYGIVISINQFVNYLEKAGIRKFTKIEKAFIDDVTIENSSGDEGTNWFINYLDTKFIPLNVPKKKESKIYLLKIASGYKTIKGYGNYYTNNYFIKKFKNGFKRLESFDADKIKTYDLDKDEFPEIIAESHGIGEADTCRFFGFVGGRYQEISIPLGISYCQYIEITSNGIIILSEENKKKFYKYKKGVLSEVINK